MTWYEESFGADYLALYPHRDDAEAERDVEQLVALIAPPPDRPLLDLGCGAGRHLLALHRRGFVDLTGIDLSQDLLDTAAQRFATEGTDAIRLIRSDMRRIPFVSHFSTILSMFTSFGYFATSAEDARMLHAVHDALCPGGAFLLDTLNRRWTIEHLIPSERRTIGDLELDIARTITPDGTRVEKETHVAGIGPERRRYRESVRMYEPEELHRMLHRAGFESIKLYGSLAGAAIDAASRRTIAVARRRG